MEKSAHPCEDFVFDMHPDAFFFNPIGYLLRVHDLRSGSGPARLRSKYVLDVCGTWIFSILWRARNRTDWSGSSGYVREGPTEEDLNGVDEYSIASAK